MKGKSIGKFPVGHRQNGSRFVGFSRNICAPASPKACPRTDPDRAHVRPRVPVDHDKGTLHCLIDINPTVSTATDKAVDHRVPYCQSRLSTPETTRVSQLLAMDIRRMPAIHGR